MRGFAIKDHLFPEGRLTVAKPLNRKHKFFQTQPLLPTTYSFLSIVSDQGQRMTFFP